MYLYMSTTNPGNLYRCKITDGEGNVVYSEDSKVVLGSETWEYTYDADGLRTKRTNGSTTYSYIYNGGQLSQMTVGSNTLYFAYDASGTPMSVTYNGTSYYYVTNIQGDVLKLVNTSGATVVEYTYDTWGALQATTGFMATTLGTHNPLRYRGYVYDEETGLYYLQSRYYDPAMGRFINADIHVATGQGIIGYNMFAYCGNNPVNRTDASGEDWWHWAVAAAVVVVAAAAVVVTAGGATAAIITLTCVANGVATCSTAATVAAGVFIGSATMFATSAYMALSESSSPEEFAEYGESAMYSTIGGGIHGGLTAYGMAQAQSPSECFVTGTLVKTADGDKPIEEISAGDLVWTWDEETGDVALKEVIETYVNETNELVHLFVNGEEIIATPTHPFYSPVKGWTDAVQLRAGDILVLVNGEYVVVEKVQHEILEAPVTVYNFNVESYHTYFITSCGILVHNKCSGSYEIEFESGKNYVGKGSERRMNVSAKIHSALNNDPVVSMSWEYAPDTQTAFVDEYFKMAVRGVNNPNTYNLIWSPGRKIFFSNWM